MKVNRSTMIYSLPSNTIGYLVISVATGVLGVRALTHYIDVRQRLSLHFVISGFTAALGLAFYSIPFIFTRDETILTATVLAGRAILSFVAFYQFFLIWYLTPLKRINIWYFFGPIIPIAFYGFFVHAQFLLDNLIQVSNNEASFSFPGASSYTHLFSLLLVMLGGIALARHALLQGTFRNKIRLFSVALIYIAASASDMYNVVYSDGGANSTISLIGSSIAGGAFLLTVMLLPSQKSYDE